MSDNKSPKSAHTGGKDRKDGKKGDTLKHKGRVPEQKSEPEGKVVTVTAVVYRASGVQAVKRSRVAYPGARLVDVSYTTEFEGHEAISFTRMGEAVARAKEAPPQAGAVQAAEAVDDKAAEAA